MNARFILSLVIGASLAATVFAQGIPKGNGNKGTGKGPFAQAGGGMRRGPGGPGGRRGQFMENELKKLHVTPAQKKKIEAFNARSGKSMTAFFKAHQNDRAAMRPMMEKMRTERMSFMKRTLSARQYKQLDADMKAMRAKMGAGRRGGGPGGPGGPRRGGPPGA